MKKILSALCIIALMISLTACSKTENKSSTSSEKDYSNSTVVGKITKISDSKITLTLGKLTEKEMQVPSGDNNGQQNSDNSQEQPPQAPPSGDNNEQQNDSSQGQPPQIPSGDNQPPKMYEFTEGKDSVTLDLSKSEIKIESNQETKDGKISDLKTDDVLQIEIGDNNVAKTVTVKNLGGNGMQGQFGGSGQIEQGTAANTMDNDSEVSSKTYMSKSDDENALRIDGATVTLSEINVNKSAGNSSNTEDGDFYGMNAGLLATNGANVTIKNSDITTNAKNGNGVFSYGEGTIVNISDSTITTTQNNSGGIQTTGGATMNAKNLTVNTSGNSSAAIRSDRGGGNVTVDGGTYTSNGTGSPAIYSTANISVSNAKLNATNSEAIVVEGKNSVNLVDCEVVGNMTGTYNNDGTENIHNIMIYQSMSGDADVGTASFAAEGGKIESKNGDMFYVTNTHSQLSLKNVELVLSNDNLLRVEGNSSSRGWGNAGANGGKVEFTASQMNMKGNIIVDTISTLQLKLTDKTSYEGSISIVENKDATATVADNVVVEIYKGSTWTLTGNCTISSLTNNGTINFNGYTITLADGTVVSK